MTEPRWYVVEAVSEQRVTEANLWLSLAGAQYGFRVWLPTVPRRDPRRGKDAARSPRLDKPVPRFGRFLLVQIALSPDLQAAIDGIPSVRGMLKASHMDNPSPVPDSQVAWLREWAAADPKRAGAPDFVAGDHVMIKKGVMSGLTAIVQSCDPRGVLAVEVYFFGQQTVAIVPADSVEMAQPAKSRAMTAGSRRGARPSRPALGASNAPQGRLVSAA